MRGARAVLAALSLGVTSGAEGQGALLDRALEKMWGETRESDRQKAAQEILRLEPDFDTLYTKLRSGRVYPSKVKTGLIEESRKAGDVRHEYVVLVPEDYDSARSYRVCFYLHGGVNRQEPWQKGDSWWRRFDRFDGEPQISVFPSSWRGALWWQRSQVENLRAILDRVKADYNVDESRVYLFGVSDGATGVYYHAFKAPTIWAAFFAFIGHPGVLQNPALGVDGELFLSNLVNKPFYIVNGEQDSLYPFERVRAYVEEFERAGVVLVFRSQPGGHNTRWWNAEREVIEAFMEDHRRVALPDRLVWETERADLFSRVHWLVIDELRGGGRGRLDLARRGNVVEAKAEGVSRFRLLLSPEQFDLSTPVEVVVNGVTSFQGKVEADAKVLLEWAARDFDRTMLFAAEIGVALASPR